MKEARLEYVDLWRISLLVDSHQHTGAELDEVAAALDWAKKSGRARFTGVSAHDRPHLWSAGILPALVMGSAGILPAFLFPGETPALRDL